MRWGRIVAALAGLGAVTACTALLDLGNARFEDVDGSNGGTEGGAAEDVANDVFVEGSSIDVEPDAGNATKCTVTYGEGDGTVPAGLTNCPGVGMVELRTNGAHCGECNRNCGAGSGCTNGQCVATVVSPEGAEPTVLAATSTHVAWTVGLDAGASTLIKGAKLDGSDARTLGVVDGQWSRYGALTGDSLFVSVQTARSPVYPLDGGASFTVGGNNASEYLVARGNEIFFETYNSDLRRVLLTPDASADWIYSPPEGITGVAVAGNNMYWVRGRNAPDDAGLYPRIGRVDVVSRAIAYSTWSGDAASIAVDGAYVYVYDRLKQDLVRVPLDLTGTAEVLAHWTGTPWDTSSTVIADGDFVYVRTNRGGSYGAVLRVPRCGGKPFVIKESFTVGRVAIGGDHVFFGDYEPPLGVKRVPK